MTVAALRSLRVSSATLGLGFTLASAGFFSGLGVLTQLALDAGATIHTVLAGRFAVAASVLLLLACVTRSQRPDPRQALAGLGLGVGYSAHAWLYTESLARLDAGLVDLLLFTYPTLVTLGAVALRRDSWSRRRAIALSTATGGIALVLVGGLHSIDPLGAALALAAAVVYAAYILACAGQLERTDPTLLAALVTTGAAVTLTGAGAARGGLSFHLGVSAFELIGAVGLVAVAGMGTFIAGTGRLGPSRASIVSAVQPALTVVLGFAVYSDRLGTLQLLGGTLVVAGVVILERGAATSESRRGPTWLPAWEGRTLARVGASIDVPAGTRVVGQGERAQTFFLIEHGHATVTRYGRYIADLGPGDFFGEIALLGGGMRTASVVAVSHMRVRVVPHHAFTQALRTLPSLARAVRRVSEERLHRSSALSAPAA